MILEANALVAVGLVLAAWTLGASWVVLAARAQVRRAEAAMRQGQRLGRLLDESPALPLIVRVDGRIEAPPRLARWLGLEAMPDYLSELVGTSGLAHPGMPPNPDTPPVDQPAAKGLSAESLAQLTQAIAATQHSGAPFRLVLAPVDSPRSLMFRGCLADPQVTPGGSVLIWVFDATDSEHELMQRRAEAARARADFAALIGLIEAAPMPMWFRGPDGALRLVNSAYVRAVGGQNAEAVIAAGTELIERVDGLSAAEVALQAAARQTPIERLVAVTLASGFDALGAGDDPPTPTLAGDRRTMRVSDLPLGAQGIAGYAVDVEEMEELGRALRAFREAQRALLDQLSAGVAQFDPRRRLVFANQPFQRLFALTPALMLDSVSFEHVFDHAREAGRVPEVRDFPAWRRERAAWFAASAATEEAWPLSDGTHLRVIGQPTPDGGLLLIVEDRTETLRIAAMRDTLLRTRTATFDSLFEAVAVFAPDGRLQVWNRRFTTAWGLPGEFVDTHPRIDQLLERLATQLAWPAQVRFVGDGVRAATLERRQTGGRIALADGRTLEFAGVPLPDGNGLLTVLDVTDSANAETALRERNAALVEADTLKTRFLANMSYEFRTPLTTIGGFAELLAAGHGGPLSASGSDYVAAILTAVARLAEQIENVLELSQSEAGLLPLARSATALMPFVTRLIEEREARLTARKLSLDLNGDAGVGQVSADPRRLARALGHLIDNAIAAAPPGGRIVVALSRPRGKGGSRARIVISDNGPGMEASVLARALGGLEPAKGGKGIAPRQGLGLPLARQLIEAHGGTLEVVSEPGRGTTAIVELP